MNAIKNLKIRHTRSVVALKEIADPIIEKHGLVVCANIIGARLNVSRQTIVNYLLGRGKDGFLTEAIGTEFKKNKRWK